MLRTTTALALAAGLIALARRRLLVVTVDGTSMLPTLRPGDRVLARRRPGHRRPRLGRLVICRMPVAGEADRPLIVKRVTGLPDGLVWVTGDGPGSHDSRVFGPLPPGTSWPTCCCGWPPGRRRRRRSRCSGSRGSRPRPGGSRPQGTPRPLRTRRPGPQPTLSPPAQDDRAGADGPPPERGSPMRTLLARLAGSVLPQAEASAACGSYTVSCGCRYTGHSIQKFYRTCYACSDGSTTCNSYCVSYGQICPV